MRRTDADYFLRGYLDAALFTTDPEPPARCDYVKSGRPAELYPSLPGWFVEQAIRECASFEHRNSALLARAGDSEQNGADFWYTRNHHGAGFWDRGYADDVSEKLTKAAHAFGEHSLVAEDLGLVTE